MSISYDHYTTGRWKSSKPYPEGVRETKSNHLATKTLPTWTYSEWRTSVSSALKLWWTQVSSWITNVRWKFLGLASKLVRSVLEMSTLHSFYPGISILGIHRTETLLISYAIQPNLTKFEVLNLAWNRVRSVLEMSNLFSLYSGISIKTHLADI